MVLEIYHNTTYKYDAPVFPEPHHLYLFPAQRPGIRILGVTLNVQPNPVGQATRVDAENNTFYQCWFDQEINELKIATRLKLEITPFNPFNFLIEQTKTLPPQFQVYLSIDSDLPDDVLEWVKAYDLKGGQLMNSLVAMNSTIGQEWGHDIRYNEGLLTPADTFRSRSGSCRDIAWMAMQMLRYCGIPTRFVSGYAFNPDLGQAHELHAWLEAYLHGAGWIAFDPTAGMLVDEHYIPICTSYDPKLTLPVQGAYRGTAGSDLSFEVIIKKSKD